MDLSGQIKDPLSDQLKAILKQIIDIIQPKGYTITGGIIEDITGGTEDYQKFNFYIKQGETIASQIFILKTTGSIIPGRTRGTSNPTHFDVFAITWLETKPGYGGQGLGLLLLIYSICVLKISNSSVNYAVLDDDSDKSHVLNERNIYGMVGFTFQDPIQIDMQRTNKILTGGPEKQLEINQNFIDRIKNLLTKKFETKKRLSEELTSEEPLSEELTSEELPGEELPGEGPSNKKRRIGGKLKTKNRRGRKYSKRYKKSRKGKKYSKKCRKSRKYRK